MPVRVGRKLVVAGCAIMAASQVAAAADVSPVFKSPPPADVPASWAGFYVGGQLGYGMDGVGWRNLGASTSFSPLDSRTRDRGNGLIGGGQVGYNFQYNHFVLGIEGSMSGAGLNRSFSSPYFPATDVWSSNLTWLGTITGRVGYEIGSWLPYVKGGYAVGNLDTSLQSNGVGVVSQGSAIHNGWTVGGGVEYKVTKQFSLGLELMRTDLGKNNDINGAQTAIATGAAVPGTSESYGVGLRSNSITARINYLFGR